MEKIKDFFDFWNKKVDRQLNEIETRLKQIFSKMKALKSDKIKELMPLEEEVRGDLEKIKKDFNRKTQDGTLLVNNLNRKTIRLNQKIEELEKNPDNFGIDRFYKEFLSYHDHLYMFRNEIDKLSYRQAGFTVMGIVLAFLPPPIGIFSVVMGAVLIFDKDVRAKLNGIIMVIIAAIVAVYHLILF